MKAITLNEFGSENLIFTELDKPVIADNEILLKFAAASINSRDCQIISGGFSPDLPLPISPISDGAGEVVAIGKDIMDLSIGDRVCPLFFPEWLTGEALRDERAVSSGLEAPGVLREFGSYLEHQVIKVPDYLSAAEAACFPCAGLTAWTSLFDFSSISAGDWVLVQGTGGVSLFGLKFAKAAGAKVIVTSSDDAKLKRALDLGADHGINYLTDSDWGLTAHNLADGLGVHAILEVGGSGTLPQSIAALRRGGHINIIGYFAGIEVGLNVFHLIERNAHVHGLSVGNRASFEAMLAFCAEHEVRPVIDSSYEFTDAAKAIEALPHNNHFGKIVVSF
jgi:NADPH:quinone reductase-like Zn-dependent oxidoreductase